MMIAETVGIIKSIAGKLFSVYGNVIPPCFLSMDPKHAGCLYNDRQLSVYIIIFFPDAECKIQIAQIMVDRSSSGKPAH